MEARGGAGETVLRLGDVVFLSVFFAFSSSALVLAALELVPLTWYPREHSLSKQTHLLIEKWQNFGWSLEHPTESPLQP